MALEVKVPELGESVKQATLLRWHKADGDTVRVDEPLCELETDKANADVPSPGAGVLRRLKKENSTVEVGEVIAQVNSLSAGMPAGPAAPAGKSAAKADAPARTENQAKAQAAAKGRRPPEQAAPQQTAPNPQAAPLPHPAVPPPPPVRFAAAVSSAAAPGVFDGDGVRREPMSKIRKRIAQNLIQAQQTAAILTTINEIDLSAVVEIRAKFKERFQEVYGVGLGYMSFFARATVLALREFPKLNAFIDGDDVVYHQYVNLGIAVSTDRGLAVPVLRNVEKMSFARIEAEVKRLAAATREGKLSVEELSGGTFTITNGGIWGSLLSTPILNPPQSGILGMHAIQKRPVVVNDKIEIRSMMYVAVSYDHRLVDGQESVQFLVRIKQYLEDPARLMLEI